MGVHNYRRKKYFNEIQREEEGNSEELVTQSAATLKDYIFNENPWVCSVKMFDERLLHNTTKKTLVLCSQ